MHLKMATIYINAIKENGQYFSISLESLIVVYVFKTCKSTKLQLIINLINKAANNNAIFKVNFTEISHTVSNKLPTLTKYSLWPIITADNSVVSGLCSVARQIIKSSQNDAVTKLLGFREASLMAPSETSVWTRFCEIDITAMIYELCHTNLDVDTFVVPKDVLRFEHHLKQPVKMHNVYKFARENKKNKDIQSSTPVNELDLSHTYGEGPFLTIADVVLFPCYQIFFQVCGSELIKEKLELTNKWFKLMEEELAFKLDIETPKLKFKSIEMPPFIKESLYKSDPERYKPQKRIYTKQADIEQALQNVQNSQIPIVNTLTPYGADDVTIDWDKIPLQINPNGGALPEKRANRKTEQLENMAKPVVVMARRYNEENLKIVDFCSGSGHLGILLAYLLPKCEIILVENKERSLLRAKERIALLKLTNIVIVQCNLDYFTAKFDIGVSLHACGVATDLVIKKCTDIHAHFVCCPCCYGGILNCHIITYPRSEVFKSSSGLSDMQYLILGHAADQTHEADNVKTKQGFLCMDVVDTDRKLAAENLGYEVVLGRMWPFTCTNKNNLLVGFANVR